MTKLRLAVIGTHPVQYTVPVLRAMAQREDLSLRTFYTWSQTAQGRFHDPGFGRQVGWDIPLLGGYEHEFVENVAREPGSHRFNGIRTPALTSRVLAWSPDAVLVIGWNNHAHLQAMRHFKGKLPVFFRGDSTLLDIQSSLKSLVRRQVLRWVYSHVDVAISVGQASRDYFEWCGIPAGRVAFAPHCIDNRRFADTDGSAQRQADAWRSELRILPDHKVVVFAGKLIAKKDPLLLLQAFLATGAQAHLVFIGNGELENDLKRLAGKHRNIHFMPFQNQSLMPAVYRLGDVFALPSCGPGETWGLALNEAMASGRPVIASDKAGATQDVVKHGYNGWCFSAQNLDGLAQVLRTAFCTSSAALRQLGENAQRLINDWSVEASADRMAETIVDYCVDSRQVAR